MKESQNSSDSKRPPGFAGLKLPAFVVIVTFAIMAILTALTGESFAATQKRARRRPPAAASRTPIDYSKFSHTTEKHRGACVTCHKIPTKNWRGVRDYPDVADFPDHAACVSCHRRQFFKGAKPQICTGCHLKSSPRDDKRYAFRNPTASLQFAIEFPHDKHQDVIARLRRRYSPVAERRPASLIRASFSFSQGTFENPAKVYNNCAICHAARTTAPPVPAGGWLDSFVPDAATFKTVPVNHASCFSCHWKSQAPVSTDCAGCHKALEPHTAPSGMKRISIKFRHAREQHVAECTTCHINITKSATLRGLSPDVPMTSCNECHNKQGLRLDVAKELEAIDRNRDFVCVYCHTSELGQKDPPANHYLVSGREPMKRKGVK